MPTEEVGYGLWAMGYGVRDTCVVIYLSCGRRGGGGLVMIEGERGGGGVTKEGGRERYSRYWAYRGFPPLFASVLTMCESVCLGLTCEPPPRRLD